MLKTYLANRAGPQENFAEFTRRHEVDALKAMFERQAAE
jgi:ferredoxin-nitrite reductase